MLISYLFLAPSWTAKEELGKGLRERELGSPSVAIPEVQFKDGKCVLL